MPKYFEFEVQLDGIEPPVWRRFRMPTTATFWQLHCALQCLFDWDDDHAWRFWSGGRKGRWVAVSHEPESEDPPVEEAHLVPLAAHFERTARVNPSCRYVYDLGDNWVHNIWLRGTHDEAETYQRRLLGGARAAPPEDCGGLYGYDGLVRWVETGETPDNGDRDDLIEWLGDWHPDAFDLKRAQRAFDE